jgi:hypothetical protein
MPSFVAIDVHEDGGAGVTGVWATATWVSNSAGLQARSRVSFMVPSEFARDPTRKPGHESSVVAPRPASGDTGA